MPEIASEDFTIDRPARHGFVATAPVSLTSSFTVLIPDFSTDHAFEIRRWMPRGEALPAVGDEVLVAEDDNEEPWVVAWWPL